MALKIKPGANGEKCVGTQGFSNTTWQVPGEDFGLAGVASHVFQMGELLKDAPVLGPWPLDQFCQGMRRTAQGQAASSSRVNEVGDTSLGPGLVGTWMFSGWLTLPALLQTSLGRSGRLVHPSPGPIRKAGGSLQAKQRGHQCAPWGLGD